MPLEWIETELECPKCEGHTEMLVDEVYDHAERCPKCGWVIRFDEDD